MKMLTLRLPQDPPPPAPTLEARKIILGEGTHDAHFFKALLDRLEITDVQTGDYGGKNGLSDALHVLQTIPKPAGPLEVLGVTRDADTNSRAAFQSICEVLAHEGYPTPDNLGEVATGKSPGGRVRVGVFIMPDNEGEGAMETLCLRSVDNDPAIGCVKEYFNCIRPNGAVRPTQSKRDKAHAQVYIASKEVPNLHPGLAAKEGYWNFDSDALDPLKKFIRALAIDS